MSDKNSLIFQIQSRSNNALRLFRLAVCLIISDMEKVVTVVTQAELSMWMFHIPDKFQPGWKHIYYVIVPGPLALSIHIKQECFLFGWLGLVGCCYCCWRCCLWQQATITTTIIMIVIVTIIIVIVITIKMSWLKINK